MKLILVILLTSLSLTVQALEPGDRLTSFDLQDQFEKPARLSDTTALVLVASSREAAGVVDEAIKEQPKGYLEARNALYVADVSQMPGFITNWFLVPSMRSANYRILLDWDSVVAPRHLGQDGQVLWLELDQGEIVERRTFTSADDLREALERMEGKRPERLEEKAP